MLFTAENEKFRKIWTASSKSSENQLKRRFKKSWCMTLCMGRKACPKRVLKGSIHTCEVIQRKKMLSLLTMWTNGYHSSLITTIKAG